MELTRSATDTEGPICRGECPICLDELTDANREVGVLECAHEFHMECLYSWFSQAHSNFKCPCCGIQRDITKIASPPTSATSSAKDVSTSPSAHEVHAPSPGDGIERTGSNKQSQFRKASTTAVTLHQHSPPRRRRRRRRLLRRLCPTRRATIQREPMEFL